MKDNRARKDTGKVNVKPSELGAVHEPEEIFAWAEVIGVCSICGCENRTFVRGGVPIPPIMSMSCRHCNGETPHTKIVKL